MLELQSSVRFSLSLAGDCVRLEDGGSGAREGWQLLTRVQALSPTTISLVKLDCGAGADWVQLWMSFLSWGMTVWSSKVSLLENCECVSLDRGDVPQGCHYKFLPLFLVAPFLFLWGSFLLLQVALRGRIHFRTTLCRIYSGASALVLGNVQSLLVH